MHRELAKRLRSARGEDQHAIVVFCDVRGFSKFSNAVRESGQVAALIQAAYRKLLDWLPDPTFFKLLGDGLMLVYAYDQKMPEKQEKVAWEVIKACQRAVDSFSQVAASVTSVALDHAPNAIGFGLAYGLVYRVHSRAWFRRGGVTLDYSGHLLNLAARLQGIADPQGIVLTREFEGFLSQKDLAGMFEPRRVYLKGVAEREPQPIWATRGIALRPENDKPSPEGHPIKLPEDSWSPESIRAEAESGRFLQIALPSRPINRHEVCLTAWAKAYAKGETELDLRPRMICPNVRFVEHDDLVQTVLEVEARVIYEQLDVGRIRQPHRVHYQVAYRSVEPVNDPHLLPP